MSIDSILRPFQTFFSKDESAGAPALSQLELALARPLERDRNFEKGGRSFYFFDFDDNVAFLSTPIFIFHKENRTEKALTSGEWARFHRTIGKDGPFRDYLIDYDDKVGSFRRFRDRDLTWLEKLSGQQQSFVEDLAAALGYPDWNWKGPSWHCFYHASLNQRPTSVITARGHRPDTVKEGIDLLVDRAFLPSSPNFLSIFPVTNPAVRAELGDAEFKMSVAQLKKAAIRASVESAIVTYGYNPFHRFGMSDDDPHNIELIVEEMTELKRLYPAMSYFVIETDNGRFVKREIFADHTEAVLCAEPPQVGVFEQLSMPL